jgi:hypothetical protein
MPHSQAAFSAAGCSVLHRIALPVVSEWYQEQRQLRSDGRSNGTHSRPSEPQSIYASPGASCLIPLCSLSKPKIRHSRDWVSGCVRAYPTPYCCRIAATSRTACVLSCGMRKRRGDGCASSTGCSEVSWSASPEDHGEFVFEWRSYSSVLGRIRTSDSRFRNAPPQFLCRPGALTKSAYLQSFRCFSYFRSYCNRAGTEPN